MLIPVTEDSQGSKRKASWRKWQGEQGLRGGEEGIPGSRSLWKEVKGEQCPAVCPAVGVVRRLDWQLCGCQAG